MAYTNAVRVKDVQTSTEGGSTNRVTMQKTQQGLKTNHDGSIKKLSLCRGDHSNLMQNNAEVKREGKLVTDTLL